jgi:hypothetical protein
MMIVESENSSALSIRFIPMCFEEMPIVPHTKITAREILQLRSKINRLNYALM